MAFSAANKKDIRKYMMVPFGFYDLNHRLESMMDLVGTNATDETEILLILTELASIDALFTVSGSTTSTATYGALKKVDEVEFYAPTDGTSTSTVGAVERGQSLINRLAHSLGVQDYLPRGDYFGTARTNTGPFALG